MKKIFLLIAATALLAGVFTSCKKDEEVAPEVKYKVTFNAMDGMFSDGKSTKDTTVLSGSKVNKPSENPILAGSVFDNWYADSLLTKVYDFNTAVTNDLTIYAKYISTEKSMTLEQQAEYLNATGIALLNQIDTASLSIVADCYFDLTHKNYRFDKDSTYREVRDYYDSLFYDKTKQNWYVNAEKMSVDIKINPRKKNDNVSYYFGSEPGTLSASFTDKPEGYRHEYTAKAKLTTTTDKLLLAGKHKDAEETSTDSLIWVYAPKTVSLDVTADGQTCASLNLNLDLTNVPDSIGKYIYEYLEDRDWKKLLPLFQFTIGGDIYLNGTNSYKIHLENISADYKDSKDVDIDLTIYGKEGTAILAGKVSANATEILRLLSTANSSWTWSQIRDIALATLKSFDLNVLTNDGARLVWNDNGNKLIELYLDEWTNHQIWFDPRDVSLASQDKEIIFNTKFINTADPNNQVVSINELKKYAPEFAALIFNAKKLGDDFKKMFEDRTRN